MATSIPSCGIDFFIVLILYSTLLLLREGAALTLFYNEIAIQCCIITNLFWCAAVASLNFVYALPICVDSIRCPYMRFLYVTQSLLDEQISLRICTTFIADVSDIGSHGHLRVCTA